MSKEIFVIGHKNPDTDSICSAIGYAYLKNHTDKDISYVPLRAGAMNAETDYVLKRFQVEAPKVCLDIRPTVKDLEIRHVQGVCRDDSQRRAWELMRDQDIHSLPVLENNRLTGIITVQDVAVANMDSFDENDLSKTPIPVKNLMRTLDASLLNGDEKAVLANGKVVVGAGDAEAISHQVKKGDVMLVANRIESQLSAMDMGASAVIICGAPSVHEMIIHTAKEKNVLLLLTPYDTFSASKLVNQSIPVSQNMTESILSFTLKTTVDEAKETMGRVRFNYFPILNKYGDYVGLISKRNVINYPKKSVVLVDHNEKAQCVDGYEEAEILGVIDHHRLGDLETGAPIFFNSQPVGCTATIVYGMFREEDIEIPKEIAGILCAAILSDTLAFRSPTCTQRDEHAAKALAEIAGVEISELSSAMFTAGENLENKTPSILFGTDCKVLHHGDLKIAISQGIFNTKENLEKAIEMITSCIEAERIARGSQIAYYVATSVPENLSIVLFSGVHAGEILEDAFGVKVEDGRAVLEGLMSRKKQFVPEILHNLSGLS